MDDELEQDRLERDGATPCTASQMALQDIIECLYELDRKDLRRLAYEALLISDGPDKIDGDVENSAIYVRRLTVGDYETVAAGEEAFFLRDEQS